MQNTKPLLISTYIFSILILIELIFDKTYFNVNCSVLLSILKSLISHYPLLIFVCSNHKEVLETLLENGAGIDLGNNGGYSALHWASQKGHANSVKFLLANDADFDKEVI